MTSVSISRKVHSEVVEFGVEHWPFEVKCRTDLSKASEQREWCITQFGPRGNDLPNIKDNCITFWPKRRWVESGDEFRFKDERDATAFKIVWG